METNLRFEDRLTGDIEPIAFLNSIDGDKLIEMHQCSPESENYEREVLFEDDKYELVFCHWKSGNTSEMHDHEGKQCWFRCLRGVLTEKKKDEPTPRLIEANSVSYIDDNMGEHQILNKTQKCTFSLHLYIRRG